MLFGIILFICTTALAILHTANLVLTHGEKTNE